MISKVLAALFLAAATLAPPVYVSAQPVDPFDDVCNPSSKSVTGRAANSAPCKDKELEGGNPLYGPQGIITKIVSIITIVVGIAAVISIIWAGIRFATSGSNPEEVTKAREYIQYALIGLILALLGQALVRMVLYKIGVTGT